MLVVVCEECGADFSTYPSEVRTGRKFCGVKCGLKGKRQPIRHGESYTRLHGIWCHMKTRCLCKTSPVFSYYGGRGIRVCKEWIDSYEAFRDWAKANGYSEDLELDRIDVDGNYCPENCRWATRREQMRNTGKRRNAKTSRFKGVSRHSQNGRWVAQICVGDKGPGKPTFLGCFGSESEAADAYDAAARKHFGAFASTNSKD
jgi:hypothetical protein